MFNLLENKKLFSGRVGLIGKILTDPRIKFLFVDKIPAGGAAACYNPGTKTVYLPAIDPNILNEDEATKVMGLSAHERKHVMLTHPEALNGVNEIIKKAKEKGINRAILNGLWQTIEDLRIEMNDNYSYPGDLSDIAYFNEHLFKEYKEKADAFMNGNPYGYLQECLRYKVISTHPFFSRIDFLPVSPELQPYLDAAISIMSDGRFTKSLRKGIETTDTTLKLALEIEKAWACIRRDNKQDDGEGEKNNQEGKQDKENGSGAQGGKPEKSEGKGKGEGQGQPSDGDLNDLSNAYSSGQETNKISDNPFVDMINALCEELIDSKIDQLKELASKMNGDGQKKGRPSRYAKDEVISCGLGDEIVIERPNSEAFLKVLSEVGPLITHVRDQIAIRLKALAEKKVLRGLRRGQIDHQRLYQTALGCKRVMKKVFPGIDYSTAVQIVVDLSGSMDHSDGGLARYEMAMQMAIILAEVFQLLKIPFEVTGFNAGYNSNHSNIEYQGNRSVHLRTEKIYYHIFKAFEDDYSIESVKHCLGAINASGYNVDHEVIRWSAARLHRRKENRKLQIILSDGLPCGGELYENELILVNDNIVKAGIEQFAFGLQCECVSKFYSKYTVLEKMEDLNTMALKIFVDFLEAGFQNQFIG